MKKSILKNTLRIISLFILSASLLLFFQNCGGDFASVNSGGLVESASVDNNNPPTPPPNLDGKALYTQHCNSCHGPVDSSAKKNRSALQINLAIDSIPLMANIVLTTAEVELIVSALAGAVVPPPVQNGSRQEFACTPGQLQKTPLVKLTNREFRNALNALLDGFSSSLKNDASLIALLNGLPTDIATQDRDTLKEQALLNTAPITNGMFAASYRASEVAAASASGLQNYPNTNQCLSASTVTQSCHQLFVRELGSRAFRRQLNTSEANTLAARLWDAALTKNELIQLTFTGLTTMPDFIYKIYDRGSPVTNGSSILNLTAHELATKLSLLVTGSPADAALRALADNGQILDNTVLDQQADRLLASAAARETIQRLFRESYGYNIYDRLQYDSAFINNINTSGLDSVMNAELDNYFTEVVLNRNGTFRDLMTSRYTNFSDSRLAAIYGASNTGTLPEERSGFLNRAAMLTKRSGYTASPIKRGLSTLEHVLCEDIGLPPPSAPTSLPVIQGEILTTRQRTNRTTEAAGTSCVQCHSRMNNLGYAFELFDSFGRMRSTEAIYTGNQITSQLPIDSSTTTSEVTGSNVTVSSSRQLVEQLGNSDKAMMCFVKHLKRFESRVATDSTANCQMNQSLKTLYGNTSGQGSIVNAIKSLILSPEFRRWNN